MNANKTLPELNEIEIRVLGSLMEKSKVTPDYYPMTLNAITAACNQKSSRNPVSDYSEEQVMSAIRSLKGYGLVSLSVGGTNRSEKYKHNFNIQFPLAEAQETILCLLFLRGPLTAGEINSNSGRLHEFSSLSSVQESLHSLVENTPAYIQEIPRKAGQKEIRYFHLFGNFAPEINLSPEKNNSSNAPNLESRIQHLESEVETLKSTLQKLLSELGYNNPSS